MQWNRLFHAQRWAEGINIRYRDRNLDFGLLFMDSDNKQAFPKTVEAEAQGLYIGLSVHIDAQGRLGSAYFDLRSPVGNIHSRRWTWLDVEDIADLCGKTHDILQIRAPVCGNLVCRNRYIDKRTGYDHWDDAEHS